MKVLSEPGILLVLSVAFLVSCANAVNTTTTTTSSTEKPLLTENGTGNNTEVPKVTVTTTSTTKAVPTTTTTVTTTTAAKRTTTTTTTIPTTTTTVTTTTTTKPTSKEPEVLQERSSVQESNNDNNPPAENRDTIYTTTTTTTKRTTTAKPATTVKPATTAKPTATTTKKPKGPAPEALMEQVTPAPAPKLGPIVKIQQGEVRPLVLRSRGGRKYYSFRGIPYANKPTGYQRFKECGPASPWSEVLNATSYGPSCIQYNILSEMVEGEEDCLHLNIFTPMVQPSRNKKESGRYPVMVFFHQGAFMFGTSSDFEEKYMMDEDVVLVTVNYRLGPFGFLNTEGDSDARGNMGLKDQILALQFVRENIQQFNGEPNLVTIFGESAGGASVHYHLLSERSKGLFNRAISMSGTALSPWAFSRSPRKNAKRLATLLNCPTTDMNELVQCLHGHDARAIAAKTKDLYDWNTDPITPFGPSVEVYDDSSSFITQTPYHLMKSGQITDSAPWMLGVVEDVCLLDAWSILVEPNYTEELNVDWHRIAPSTFMFKDTALEPDAVSNQIRAYYFGTQDIGNYTATNLTNLYSDRYFNHGIRTSALLHVKTNEATPVYMYIFSFKGTQSHTKFAGIKDILGVSEGDDLRYLFNTGRFEDIRLNTTEGDISQRFVKLWVSFAKEGKPSAVWGGQEWKRISQAQVTGDEALMYYSLNDKCGFVEEPFTARMNFWDTLPLNENDNEMMVAYNFYNQRANTGNDDDDFFSSYI